MQTLLATTKVKSYTVKIYADENNRNYFNCNCIYQKTHCIARGVPCKHILSIIFTKGDCAKWESIRQEYAQYANLKNVSDAEIPLAKGLKENDPKITKWFKERL